MKNKELAFKIFEFVQHLVDGDIQEMNIYLTSYSNLVIHKDGKKINVTISFEEEEKDA